MAPDLGDSTSFVYSIYVHAPVDGVWRALTDPVLMQRYWRHHRAGPKAFRSDWKKGSTYELTHEQVGLVVSDPEQVVLEAEPDRRLSYTWHSFTPQWAEAVGMDRATADAWRSEPRSTVSVDLEDAGLGVTKLTVTHGQFAGNSQVLRGIANGWPAILSSMKTMLETGTPLPW